MGVGEREWVSEREREGETERERGGYALPGLHHADKHGWISRIGMTKVSCMDGRGG